MGESGGRTRHRHGGADAATRVHRDDTRDVDDRPGVVHEISTALSEAGISISRMGTVTDLPSEEGGKRFEITVQLTVPVGTDLDAVLDSIMQAAASLGVAIDVEDLTGDDAGS